VLFKLPPKWRRNIDRLTLLLIAVPKLYRCAFEFRDPSWLAADVYEILTQHNASLCIFDMEGRVSPNQITADFVYVRLHGPGMGKYEGRCDTRTLAGTAKNVERLPDLDSIQIYLCSNEPGSERGKRSDRRYVNLLEKGGNKPPLSNGCLILMGSYQASREASSHIRSG